MSRAAQGIGVARSHNAPLEPKFRRVRLDCDPDVIPRYWYAESPGLTHFFNALSAAFPDGEQYFIDAVRAQLPRVSCPRLLEQVRVFTKQEGHHHHHHSRFNRTLSDCGLPIDRCASIARIILDRSRRRDSPMMQLAKTAAFEHFTALIADWLLRVEESRGSDAHRSVAPLWLWHAVEETEHKAVAFDVYRAAGGSYWMRVLAMVWVTCIFIPTIHWMQWVLLRSDPAPIRWKDLLRTLGYLYLPGGLITGSLGWYAQYFKPSFHPWDHDNACLVTNWQTRLEATPPDSGFGVVS